MTSDSDSDNKIKIYYHDDQFLVWKSEDALKLRQKHRIVGTLIGPYPGEPYQINKNGLPLQLMEQETKLLLDNQVADLIQIELEITPEVVDSYNLHLDATRTEYSKLATERRLKEIEDHLASGSSSGRKRKRNLSTKMEDKLSDTLELNDQLEKEEEKFSIQTMNNDLLPVQLFTECPWPRKEEVINGKWLYPQKERDKLLYNIFRDLWKRGYYITNGFKYGCDYLAYEFDPLVFHSKYMVICQSSIDNLKGLQFLILKRIGSQANKQLLIASLTDNQQDSLPNQQNLDQSNNCKPIYLSIDWQGNQDSPEKRSNFRPSLLI